ncbi:MAG: hypothetical protein HPY79_03670 [Bacteroidales bacterium]|nr:hypothetical protein [Bacteroidales bacterium]
MQQKSTPFWFFGLFGSVFVVFVIVISILFPIDKSQLFMVIISILIFGFVSYLLLKKAIEIDRNNKTARQYGLRITAKVIKHSKAFNFFSSKMYKVLVVSFNVNGEEKTFTIKTNNSDIHIKYPVGSNIEIIHHPATGSTIINI